MEINTAPYETLIRIPGIGIKGAMKIINARKISFLNFYDLKKLGVVIKRAQYFVVCKGKYYGAVDLDEEKVRAALKPKIDLNYVENEDCKQLSLFDIPALSKSTALPPVQDKTLLLEDRSSYITGEL